MNFLCVKGTENKEVPTSCNILKTWGVLEHVQTKKLKKKSITSPYNNPMAFNFVH